jgi:hypothetical protein
MLSVARRGARGHRVMATAWSAATRAVAAAIVVLVQSGCPPRPVVHEITFDRYNTLDSRSLVGRPAEIARLLVVADVEPKYFPESMLDGFHDAVTNRLAACGVQSSVLQVDPTVLDSDDRVAAELQSSHPNVILMMRSAGAHVVGRPDGFHGTMWFDLAVLDARSQAPTWRARSTIDVTVGPWSASAETGAQLATGIVSRLRDDGVLAGCPPRERAWPEITPPPGCLQQRQRVFREAREAWDDDLRVAKLRTAPTCDTAPGAR